ncbi:MAG: oligosaccharide flippase family protein [Prolixibacteraceae bacterium]
MNKITYYLKLIFKSNLFKNSSVYTIASFTNAAIPFLLLPILTKYLTTSDYGIISMFSTVVAFLIPFVGFNLDAAVTRRFYSKDTDLATYLWNSLLILISTTIFSIGLFFAFRNTIEIYTKIPVNWLLLIPVVASAQFLCSLNLVLWQVREKPFKYAIFQILQSALNASLTILFVVVLFNNWKGRILSIVISTSVFALIAVFVFWKQNDIKILFKYSYLKNALRYGGGLIPHALGGSLILLTNRFFLTKMVNIDESGLYGVANQICSIIPFITFSFNNAFVPWLYKKLAENKEIDKRNIVKFTYAYFVIILLFGLIYYLFQPLIFNIFIGKQFHTAIQYSLWILLGFAFQGMYFMVTNYILYSEKTHIIATITIFIGIVNIPLNYLLITLFGGIGAAISFAAIFFIYFIATWLVSAKLYPMPWTLKKSII